MTYRYETAGQGEWRKAQSKGRPGARRRYVGVKKTRRAGENDMERRGRREK